MTKATTKLSAQDHVILFCVATGTDHASVGILPQAMQSMALRGFIEHDRETGAYRLADSGRATLAMILDHGPAEMNSKAGRRVAGDVRLQVPRID